MNVQEFVKSAITKITAGVADAREGLAEFGASAGSDKVYGYTKDNKILTDEQGRTVTLVEFDVAFTQADSKDTKGSIGVFLKKLGSESGLNLYGLLGLVP